MYKYKEPLTKEQINLLKQLEKKDFSNYNETDIREEYIAPMLTILGYKKDSDYQVIREDNYKVEELYLNVGRERIKLDYIFNIRKRNFWIIEAKKGEKKEISKDDCSQAYLYSLHPQVNCRYFVVTNGWLFNIYDRNKFLNDDDTDVLIPILSIKNSELLSKYNELYSILGSSNIIFNVKEKVILAEIEKTLSAEIYPNRLIQFEEKVNIIISKSMNSVHGNIRNILESKRNERFLEFEKDINSLSISNFDYRLFNYGMGTFYLDTMYKKIKKDFIYFKDTWGKENVVSKITNFFLSVFIHNKELFNNKIILPPYFYNITYFLIKMKRDKELEGLFFIYDDIKINKNDMLELYFIKDLFNFFENNIYTRVCIILYPKIYRLAKILLSIDSPTMRETIINKIRLKEFYMLEEDLATSHINKQDETIIYIENFTITALIYLLPEIIKKDSYNKEYLNKEYYNNILEAIDSFIEKAENKIKIDYEIKPIDNYNKNILEYIFDQVELCFKREKYELEDNEIKKVKSDLYELGFLGNNKNAKYSKEEVENIIKELNYNPDTWKMKNYIK
ncbi:hypothetical protein EPJ67_04195 [Brachyspira aalborgi]|uniref:Uncharacterized protein n=1 Tax=Brachyspira aalborgi TaxID=29522 RepID=A0A5C8G7E7_9SPIR|nr:type I restriction enzyme HsdR N-terminal domain-containing protein [Brachyspira aalborgi]TXJ57855.1 hypothetical protein EPJ67_04195 [Brachyspira aalborgi]